MKDIFLVYDTSCFYEIVILNYFMSFTKCEVILCSLDGKAIRTTEGYSVNVDTSLNKVNLSEVRSFIIPGGDVSIINNKEVKSVLQELKKKNVLIAGICAGVDLLDEAGILQDIKSTHSTDEDVINDSKVITSRANGYVDFAIEVAKELELFEDDTDLEETIDFWKHYKRVQ
ncbi:DJ-1/PfpI family protein [Sedimentibacter sp.]|uniref:DJ-1/PfpI family protein n=1 Tax=Sedimentibacter sp. TaxID=1960295 RepID=UPI0028AAE2DB|nr:DJ-1/PfpI family protein [Sedimentibacter sp.]